MEFRNCIILFPSLENVNKKPCIAAFSAPLKNLDKIHNYFIHIPGKLWYNSIQ